MLFGESFSLENHEKITFGLAKLFSKNDILIITIHFIRSNNVTFIIFQKSTFYILYLYIHRIHTRAMLLFIFFALLFGDLFWNIFARLSVRSFPSRCFQVFIMVSVFVW